ncbi:MULTISPECIES: DUF4169 family protein [unclassified Yoonia]|uniref:DUF4169 family protein n=1 Tax=unclassified Yoonia TaxID=2629118 RepID=UPI002AFEFE54|nr:MULTISPECIES: DUF4169 family protein [unclassified Yoonia]
MKLINLNKARKTRDRAADKAKADENAIRFGRTKAERVLDAARVQQASDRLSQLKFEDE